MMQQTCVSVPTGSAPSWVALSFIKKATWDLHHTRRDSIHPDTMRSVCRFHNSVSQKENAATTVTKLEETDDVYDLALPLPDPFTNADLSGFVLRQHSLCVAWLLAVPLHNSPLKALTFTGTPTAGSQSQASTRSKLLEQMYVHSRCHHRVVEQRNKSIFGDLRKD